MPAKLPYPTARHWSGLLLSLLTILTLWTSAWPQARQQDAGSMVLSPLGARMHVAVHEGHLVVDLRQAPVQDVLAAIGQQTGLRIRIDAATHRLVTAQFAAMDVEHGLRRLLRTASLSYALRYTPGPDTTVTLNEVRVFGEARSIIAANSDWARVGVDHRTAVRQAPPLQEEPEDLEPAGAEPEEPDQDDNAAED